MANKTYIHTFQFSAGVYPGVSGIQWKIVIEDTETVGTESILPAVRSDGFIMSFSKVDPFLYTPVGSNVIIPLIVTGNIEEELIMSIAQGQEGRFLVTIFKDDVLWWAGVLLNDLSSSQSIAKPYEYHLSATDFLAAQKDLEYGFNENMLYQGSETIIEHLLHVLNSFPTQQYWGVDDVFLCTACNWNEDSVQAGNILANTRFDHDAFINTNKYNEKTCISRWEVLQQLCKRFNARLYLHEGCWYFEQIHLKENDGYTTYKYKKSGTLIGSEIMSLSKSGESKADRQMQYLPPLLRVKQEYKYKEGANNGNLLDASYDIGQSQSLGTIPVDGAFDFSGTMRTTVVADSGSMGGLAQVRLRITFKVGTYYFTNEGGTEQWLSDGSVHYYEIWNPLLGARACPDGKTTVFSISVSFFTPPIPVTGSGMFTSMTTDYIDENSPVPIDFHFISEWIDPVLLLTNAEGTLTEGEMLYQATNTTDGTTPVKSSSVFETDEQLLIGDGPNPYSVGRLEVFTGVEWQSADVWNVSGVPGDDDISNIAIRERLALQLGVRQRLMSYTYIGYCNVAHILQYNSENYICDGGEYAAGINQFRGDFTKIKTNRTHIKIEAPLNAEGSQATGTSGGTGGSGGTSGITPGELLNILSSIIQQGVVHLTAANNYTADISFTRQLLNTNYSYPEWGRSGNRLIPVSVTNKTTTGFTVTALSPVETQYMWFVILK